MTDFSKGDELNTQIQYRLIERLAESERRYRTLVENLSEIVFKVDPLGQITFLNPAWTKILGFPINSCLGKPLAQFMDETEQASWQMTIANLDHCAILRQELHFRDHNQQTVWLEITIQPRGADGEFSGSLTDVTDRHQAEQLLQRMNTELEKRVAQRTQALNAANQKLQATIERLQQTQCELVQSEKMSGLVQLVAGVAHEINNPVNFIHGNLEYLEEYLQTLIQSLETYQAQNLETTATIPLLTEPIDLDFLKEDSQKIINSMRTGTHRIRQIVLDLRNFSRIDESELKTISVHEDIDGILKILGYQLKAKLQSISISKNYGQLPLIECYPRYLNQALMSILENAIDAIEEAVKKVDSKIIMPSSSTYFGTIEINTFVLDSQWVAIEISDNGIGIPLLIQGQVFNPFFTTKDVGKGTGMGLAISYQIITEKHRGKLSFRSQYGQGTTFTIQIPIQQTNLADSPAQESANSQR